MRVRGAGVCGGWAAGRGVEEMVAGRSRGAWARWLQGTGGGRLPWEDGSHLDLN